MKELTKKSYTNLIQAIIEDLTHRDQLILQLYYIEGLRFPEIARVLHDTPEGIETAFVKAVDTCLGPIQQDRPTDV